MQVWLGNDLVGYYHGGVNLAGNSNNAFAIWTITVDMGIQAGLVNVQEIKVPVKTRHAEIDRMSVEEHRHFTPLIEHYKVDLEKCTTYKRHHTDSIAYEWHTLSPDTLDMFEFLFDLPGYEPYA